MGIPLYNIPEVRRFYDKDYDGVGEFDLSYFKPSSEYPKHVIAARITAENPDEGFKPTSGKIDRINFQVRDLSYKPPPLSFSLSLSCIPHNIHSHA